MQYDIYKLQKEPKVFERTVEKILHNHTRNIKNWNDLTAKLKSALISKFPKVKDKQKQNKWTTRSTKKARKRYKLQNIWRYFKY